MQESQPLGDHLLVEIDGAGRVAARSREAGHKTKLDLSSPMTNTIGIVLVAALAATAPAVLAGVAIKATADQVSH